MSLKVMMALPPRRFLLASPVPTTALGSPADAGLPLTSLGGRLKCSALKLSPYAGCRASFASSPLTRCLAFILFRLGSLRISLTADKIQTVTVQDRNIEEHLQASFVLPRSAI
eukprot:g6354.t1